MTPRRRRLALVLGIVAGVSIAGALALDHAQIDPEFGATLAKLLNRFVTKAKDRALLGLPERTEQEPANEFQAVAGKETA